MDLPLELYPHVFDNLPKPEYLAACCLLNRAIHSLVIPLLYRRISIYAWHKGAKQRVLQTFTTLSNCPNLAKYVQSLEIRDFPKAQHEGRSNIFSRGLRNCINLRHCVWTRDGSLNDEIIRSLSELKQLQSLTINGHSTSEYNERLLLQIRGLRDVSLIMPSLGVVDTLSDWAAVSSLRSLELICKSSSYVTNDKLDALASACPNLERLRLIGCVKVTHVGLYKILSSNSNGLTDIGLEGLSPNFDIHQFATRACSYLKRLSAITLTIDKEDIFGDWITSVIALLQQAPLQQLQIYSTGTRPGDPSDDQHWTRLINQHCDRLTRFSIHRMLLSLDVIDNICRRCVVLEQLFVAIQQSDLDNLDQVLPSAVNLRTLHINFPHELIGDEPPVLLPSKASAILQHTSETLTQFGCNTRVWQVSRSVIDEGGSIRSRRFLSRYEKPDIPDQFLVVHT
ncbi:hypothetical protein ONZ45_g1000 [Pleurotus djamor]|nr:hypothetical protein ONZ45_g1000 [Pleurotus djamor]